MKKVTEINFLTLSIVISSLFFIPVFLRANIGSDWDSYALIGTYINFIDSGIYIPSRPPGFPVFEILIGLMSYISNYLGLNNFEKGLLIIQFLTLITGINQQSEKSQINLIIGIYFGEILLMINPMTRTQ